MQKNNKVSYLSIASVIVSAISVASFCLMIQTSGMQKEAVRIVWVATGMISLYVPIVAKYFRKKNGQKGRRLEIVALILGFVGCDFVLIYAVELNHNIGLLICIAFCVVYAKLFNNIAAPVSNEKVECRKEDSQICEAEAIMKCKICGKEIPSESAYCLHCGKKVSRSVKRISAASIVIIIVLVMFILFSCSFLFYCFANYQNAMNAMFSQNFIAADMQFRKIPYAECFLQNELEYVEAGVLMEQGDYVEALNAFNNVKYPVPISIIENITDSLYTQSKEHYENGRYLQAKKGFDAISSYKDSEKYILLTRYHLFQHAVSYDTILNLLGFEDTAEIILKNNGFFKRFMTGDWKTEKGNMYFRIDYTGHSHFNLPFIDVTSEYYELSSGIYFDVHSDGSRTKQFEFSIIDKNTASVLCYKNNENYILVRKQK